MMKALFSDKFIYHIYPIGMCNAAKHNDFCSPKTDRLLKLKGELERIRQLGVNAIYIGPLFESSSHGYDTVDFFYVDRRLGNNDDFISFVDECHRKGMAVVVDAVFNHTGRDFFAFKDIILKGKDSRYAAWYKNLNFSGHSPYGDNFSYEGWSGCMDLIKLDVDNAEVQEHIFSAVEHWIKDFHIDGLRLDAADVLSLNFLKALRNFTKSIKADFWLMGEVVHGDYNSWVNSDCLDSVTNYQIYKGLWSSFNDGNMYELAYNLNDQFGQNGKYRHMCLYNFLDNHDVNRLASTVKDNAYLFELYGLLFTIPGIPSIYYSSEYGICGKRGSCTDYELRPPVKPFKEGSDYDDFSRPEINPQDLADLIKRFSAIRKNSVALQKGDYSQLFISNTAFAFKRAFYGEEVIIIVNQAKEAQTVQLPPQKGNWHDLLNGECFSGEAFDHILLAASWLRILSNNR